MAHTPTDADALAATIRHMCTRLRMGERREAIIKTGEDAVRAWYRHAQRARQDDALDTAQKGDEPTAGRAAPAPTTRPRKREQARRQLFVQLNPATILAPANIVAVYLHTHPMWKSWQWADTAAINAQMLPFVQKLDPTNPLPDDPRLALPMTIAGLMIVRALHVQRVPRAPRANRMIMIQDIYQEIIDGVVQVDAVWTDVVKRKLAGEVSAAFLQDFTEVQEAAQTLLLRPNAGEEGWDLILRCHLGGGCRQKPPTPYYVPPPGGAGHGACRTAASRAKRRRV
jgi:hypothetical protein